MSEVTREEWLEYYKCLKEIRLKDGDINIYLYSNKQITSFIKCHNMRREDKWPDTSIFKDADFKRTWCPCCHTWTMHCPSCGTNMCGGGNKCPTCDKTYELDSTDLNITRFMKFYERYDDYKWAFFIACTCKLVEVLNHIDNLEKITFKHRVMCCITRRLYTFCKDRS